MKKKFTFPYFNLFIFKSNQYFFIFFMPVLMAYYETEAKIETSVALTLRYDICDI